MKNKIRSYRKRAVTKTKEMAIDGGMWWWKNFLCIYIHIKYIEKPFWFYIIINDDVVYFSIKMAMYYIIWFYSSVNLWTKNLIHSRWRMYVIIKYKRRKWFYCIRLHINAFYNPTKILLLHFFYIQFIICALVSFSVRVWLLDIFII